MPNITELLKKLAPQSLTTVLETYINTWQEGGNTPFITLFLTQGSQITGEIIHISFEMEQLTLRTTEAENQLDVLFVHFEHIQAFKLHQLEKCEVFVGLLH
jgi:hypothetical protein